MTTSRRDFISLASTLLSPAKDVPCIMHTGDLAVETQESPFFEHFHFLSIPLEALVKPPEAGIVLTTTPVDQDSYDVDGFKKFIASSGLNEKNLLVHTHDIKLSKDQLQAIASGQKNVEVRVISQKGNYVHNFRITASPMILATIKNKKAAKETP